MTANLPVPRDPNLPRIADIIPLPVQQPPAATQTASILRYAAAILNNEADHHERLAQLTPTVPCPAGCGANLAVMSEAEQVRHWNSHGTVAKWGAKIRGWGR